MTCVCGSDSRSGPPLGGLVAEAIFTTFSFFYMVVIWEELRSKKRQVLKTQHLLSEVSFPFNTLLTPNSLHPSPSGGRNVVVLATPVRFNSMATLSPNKVIFFN